MMLSCYDQYCDTAKRYSEKDFLHIPLSAVQSYSDRAVNYTYQNGLDATEELIRVYTSVGIIGSTRIGLMLDNRAEFFLHFLALNALGCSIVPIHAQYTDEEMQYLVAHSGLKLFVCLAEYEERVSRLCEEVDISILVANTETLSQLKPLQNTLTKSERNLDLEAAILYTSGTTGKPKGCVLSNRYFLSWGNWYREMEGAANLRLGQERLATPLPTNHQNAMACSFMGMVSTGGCVIQLDRFHSSTWWDTIRASNATIIHYLGVMPAMLMNMPVSAQDDFGEQLRFGLGAGVDPKHHAAFEARFGFPLVEGWAMTETGGTACIMASLEPRNVGTRCIGKPPGTLDFKLVDEHGQEVDSGEPGELLVKTRGDDPRQNFFVEYLKNPEATAEAWDGGYFHTGDVVRVDNDGYMYFVDRRKNVIRRSGENISAVEVEAALLQQDLVHSCAVTSVEDEFRGEEVLAIIKLEDQIDASVQTAEKVIANSRQSLAYFKVPGHVIFVQELPVGSTQKVKRGEIKELRDELLNTPSHFNLCHLKKSKSLGSTSGS